VAYSGDYLVTELADKSWPLLLDQRNASIAGISCANPQTTLRPQYAGSTRLGEARRPAKRQRAEHHIEKEHGANWASAKPIVRYSSAGRRPVRWAPRRPLRNCFISKGQWSGGRTRTDDLLITNALRRATRGNWRPQNRPVSQLLTTQGHPEPLRVVTFLSREATRPWRRAARPWECPPAVCPFATTARRGPFET
jgi:hypothetical protein